MSTDWEGEGGGGMIGAAGEQGSYHLQLSGGKVVGPLKVPMIRQMVRAGRLKGEEGVSEDRKTWLPILSVPFFAEMFEGAEEPSLPAPKKPVRSTVMLTALPDADEDAGGALAFGASGSSQSVGPMTTDEGSGLFGNMEELPGRVAPAAPPGPKTGRIGEGLSSTTGLNLPNPFADDLPGRPASAPPPPTSTVGLPAFDGTLPAPQSDLPGRKEQEDLPGYVPPVPGGVEDSDLPGRRQAGDWTENLPGRAGDLPGHAGDLPGRAGGDLPGREGDLPGVAESAWQAQASTAEVSELDLDEVEELEPTEAGGNTGFAWEPEGGSVKSATGQTANLEDFWGAASGARSGSTQTFEAPEGGLAGAGFEDDFFAGADASADEAPSAPPRPPPSATTTLDAISGGDADDPFAGSASGEDDFGSFFDGASPSAAAGTGATPSSSADDPSDAPRPEAAAVSTRKPSATKKRKNQRLVLVAAALLALVVVALGAVVYTVVLGGGDQEDAAPVVVAAPETERQVVVQEREDISVLLRRAGFSDLNTIVTQARQDRNASPELRAQWLVGLSIAVVVFPELGVQREVMDRLFDALSTAEASEAVQLARGAYLAAIGDEGAIPVLALLEEGEASARALTYTGIYHLQVAAGVVEDPEEQPPSVELSLRSADQVLARAMSSDPDWALPAYLRARAALAAANYTLARQTVTAVLERQSDHVGALLLAAQLDKRTGRISAAEEGIAVLLERHGEAASPRQQASALALKAELEFARFRLEAAIESMSAALRVDASDVVLVRRLAEFYRLAGRHAQALEFFRSPAAHGMERVEIDAAVGFALIATEQLEEARRHAERLKGDHPSDGRFPHMLGLIAEERTQFAAAREHYQEALRVDPEYVDPEFRLVELDRLGSNRGSAMERLDRMSRNTELTSSLALRIADAYSQLNEMTPAIRHYIRSIELDQANSLAWLNLIEYYLDGGQYQRAMARIQELLDIGSAHPRLSFNRARALLGLGEHTAAIEEMLGLLESEPNNVDYLLLSGRIHLSAGNYRAAKERLDQARDRGGFHPEVLLLKAQTEFALENFQDAISVLTTLSARQDNGEVRYWLARTLEQIGQVTAAIDEYTRAIDQDSGWALEHPEAFENRGRILLSRGARAPAMRDLRLAVTLRPQSPRANALFARALFEVGEFSTAIRYFERAMERGWDDPSALYFTGMAHLGGEQRDLRAAYSYLQRAETTGYGRTRHELYRRLGYVARELRLREDALRWFRLYLRHGDLSNELRREIENEIRRLGEDP